jgi:hypothetical protein
MNASTTTNKPTSVAELLIAELEKRNRRTARAMLEEYEPELVQLCLAPDISAWDRHRAMEYLTLIQKHRAGGSAGRNRIHRVASADCVHYLGSDIDCIIELKDITHLFAGSADWTPSQWQQALAARLTDA